VRVTGCAGLRVLEVPPYGDNTEATAWMGLRLDGHDWALGPSA
jgi:hypothetical protein